MRITDAPIVHFRKEEQSMDSKLCDRREFYARLASLLAGLGVAVAAFGSTIASQARVAGDKASGNTGRGQAAGSRPDASHPSGMCFDSSPYGVDEACSDPDGVQAVYPV